MQPPEGTGGRLPSAVDACGPGKAFTVQNIEALQLQFVHWPVRSILLCLKVYAQIYSLSQLTATFNGRSSYLHWPFRLSPGSLLQRLGWFTSCEILQDGLDLQSAHTALASHFTPGELVHRHGVNQLPSYSHVQRSQSTGT